MQSLYYTLVSHLPFALMILISLPFHEFAHAFVANRLGDDTAYYQGRLTLNPLAHLDLWGTLSMVLFGFGWARPVPINPTRFRGNMRRGMALTALAGPVANLILSLLFLIFAKLLLLIGNASGLPFFFFCYWLFWTISFTNILLAFFNLLPIPPLDGSRILNFFLPYRAQAAMDQLERYSFLILLAVIFIDNRTGILSTLIRYAASGIFWLFDRATFFLGSAPGIPLSALLAQMAG